MRPTFSRSWLKALSAVFSSLSAVWYGVGILGPGFVPIKHETQIVDLILYLIFGTLFLIATVKVEEILETI